MRFTPVDRKDCAGFLIALILFSVGGCKPSRTVSSVNLTSPAVPLGFKIDAADKYCRWGSLTFKTEFDYEKELASDDAIALLKDCVIEITNATLVSDVLIRPSIAGVQATVQFASCVARKAKKHIDVRNAQVGLVVSDWEKCNR